jgi:hypothetical protein
MPLELSVVAPDGWVGTIVRHGDGRVERLAATPGD